MLLYNLVVLLYGLVIKIASIRNHKAKLWVQGRKNWRQGLSQKMTPYKEKKKVWIHCASLGEFEQGRPMMEAIRSKYPDHCIVLSFFSPSGYEIRKDYDKAHVVCYLPLDTKANAVDFLNIIEPSVIVFIKYEFWVNFLNEIKRRGISTYLVSAVFKEHHPFFKWYGGIFIRSLMAFKKLFVQDARSYDLLKPLGFENIEICGDTRFDRVLEIKNDFKPIPEFEAFKGKSKLMMAGSTWPKDDELVITAFKELNDENLKLVIAPHEIDKASIDELVKKLNKHQLSFSLFTESIQANRDVLVLNTMGMLSRSYFYADLAYIGGGFDNGIHNILEAAVFDLPVTFGDKADYNKYNEAIDLLKLGCAFKVQNSDELVHVWKGFEASEQKKVKLISDLDGYFKTNANVTAKLMKAIDFV